jgi:methionyl-tRNA formyltransferase
MTNPIKIVFLGTPEFACPFLEHLAKHQDFEIKLVITQEDKKTGRKQVMTPPPIKKLSNSLGLETIQRAKLNTDDLLIEKIKSINPDFLLVIAFGQILSSKILAIPKIKAINVHGSILPKYRGASPIEQSLLNGDQQTGLTVMEMVKAMDAGPIYTAYPLEISKNDTNHILREKLSKIGAEKLPETLKEIYSGKLLPIAQKEEFATYCHKIIKEDGLINPLEMTADQIINRYRAFFNWPGIFIKHQNKQIKLHQIEKSELIIEAGKFKIDQKDLYLGTKSGSIKILNLQLEGKTAQTSEVFLTGNKNLFS